MYNSNNELIINNKTNLNIINDKGKYNKLVIKCKINPKKLNDFNNIKEITIDYLDLGGYNYNEKKINLLAFKENIEKINFKQIENYGFLKRNYRKITYNILNDFHNLKAIEFPSCIRNISCSGYLKYVSTLEEIIFNINNNTDLWSPIFLYSKKLKKLIIKYTDKEYVINLDYEIKYIRELYYDCDSNNIYIEYCNDDTQTIINIDIKTDKIKVDNILYANSAHTLYIPDYITELYIYEKEKIHKISFNLKLLNYIEKYKNFISNKNYELLETIELRNNNTMQLFPNKIINIKEYGILKELYIENNLLYLVYNECTLTINSEGNIQKLLYNKKEEILEENTKELELKKYTVEELEEYLSYLKLLKISNETDQEYKKAMEIVEDRVIKRLKK